MKPPGHWISLASIPARPHIRILMGNAVVLGWAVASRIFPHPGSFLYLLVSLAVFAAGQGHGGGRSGEASGTRAETLCAKW